MRLMLFIVALLLLAGGGYYYFLHPPSVLKRETEGMLEAFAETVATKDRAQISEHLRALLPTSGTVHLEVHMFSLTEPDRPMVQDFDQAQFIAFVDNVLYPLTDYAYQPTLESFALNDDGTAQVAFSSQDWADGISYYGGTGLQVRYSADTACNATLRFEQKQPLIDALSCAMRLRLVPKPGEAQKLRNPEAMREILR